MRKVLHRPVHEGIQSYFYKDKELLPYRFKHESNKKDSCLEINLFGSFALNTGFHRVLVYKKHRIDKFEFDSCDISLLDIVVCYNDCTGMYYWLPNLSIVSL